MKIVKPETLIKKASHPKERRAKYFFWTKEAAPGECVEMAREAYFLSLSFFFKKTQLNARVSGILNGALEHRATMNRVTFTKADENSNFTRGGEHFTGTRYQL